MKKLLILLFLSWAATGSSQVVNLTDSSSVRSYTNSVILPNNTRSITAQNFNNLFNGLLNILPNDSISLAQGTTRDTLFFWRRKVKAFYVLLRVGSAGGSLSYSTLNDVSLTTLSDNQLVKYDAASTKWKNFTLDKAFIGLPAVENTAISTWAGSSNLNHTGTITVGIWQGSPIADAYISSAANWNSKQNAITLGLSSQYFKGDLTLGAFSPSTVGLGNVPNVDATNASNLSSGSVPAGRFGNGTVGIAAISATGGSSTDFLRKDGTWATPSASAGAFSTLTDVALASIANNQLTRWNSTTSKWNNFTPGSSEVITWLGYTPMNPSGTTGQYWRGNGSLATFPTDLGSFTNGPGYLAGTVAPNTGGTGLTSYTAYSILAAGTTSTGNFQQIGVGTAGQVMTSNGPGALPSMQNPPTSSSYALLTDVAISSIAAGQLAHWNAGTSKWNNFTPGSSDVTTWLGYTPMNPTGTTAQYWRGNGTLATFPTVVSSFVNDANYLTANQSISFAPGGAGDVTGTSSGATSLAPTLNIGTNKVTYAKFQQNAAKSFVGNSQSGASNNRAIFPKWGLTWDVDSVKVDSAALFASIDTVRYIHKGPTWGLYTDPAGSFVYDKGFKNSASIMAFTNSDSSNSFRLLASGATAGTYANATVTVDSTGRVTGISAGGAPASYTFQQSISNVSGIVNLDGDVTSPGNSFLYSTNGSGTRGWNAFSSFPVVGPSNNGLQSIADKIRADSNIFVNNAPIAGDSTLYATDLTHLYAKRQVLNNGIDILVTTAHTQFLNSYTINADTTAGDQHLGTQGFTKRYLPTWGGSTAQTILGTVGTGVWNGTTIAPGFGGTGLTSYAVGDLPYASGTTTLSKLADVATGNALLSGGVGAAPIYGKIGLTTHVSGILPVANGGFGLSTYTVGDIPFANGTGSLTTLHDVATGNVFLSGGIGVAPVYGKVGLTTHVTGVLGLANGGLGNDLSGTGGTGFFLKQPTVGGAIIAATIGEGDIIFTDVTTNNASTLRHGYAPKLPNNSALFYNGVGGFTNPLPTGGLDNGPFTPTLTNITGLSGASLTPINFRYLRLGNTVIVTGSVATTPLPANGVAYAFSMTLPIPSNYVSGSEISGTATPGQNEPPGTLATINSSGVMLGNAQFKVLANGGNGTVIGIVYSYTIQ